MLICSMFLFFFIAVYIFPFFLQLSYLLCCSTIDLTEKQHSSDESSREEMAVAATMIFNYMLTLALSTLAQCVTTR